MRRSMPTQVCMHFNGDHTERIIATGASSERQWALNLAVRGVWWVRQLSSGCHMMGAWRHKRLSLYAECTCMLRLNIDELSKRAASLSTSKHAENIECAAPRLQFSTNLLDCPAVQRPHVPPSLSPHTLITSFVTLTTIPERPRHLPSD